MSPVSLDSNIAKFTWKIDEKMEFDYFQIQHQQSVSDKRSVSELKIWISWEHVYNGVTET